MRSFLKVVMILSCIQRGESHWLRSLMSEKQKTPLSLDGDQRNRYLAVDVDQTESSRVGPSSVPIIQIPMRTRRSSSPDSPCSLRSVLLQVRDLGLGYNSDEMVLFKYCSGTCPYTRSNHDLTLTNLRLNGVLPHPAPGEHDTPCCRPTQHEDMAFLDNSHRWHKVENLSAAGCSCVG